MIDLQENSRFPQRKNAVWHQARHPPTLPLFEVTLTGLTLGDVDHSTQEEEESGPDIQRPFLERHLVQFTPAEHRSHSEAWEQRAGNYPHSRDKLRSWQMWSLIWESNLPEIWLTPESPYNVDILHVVLGHDQSSCGLETAKVPSQVSSACSSGGRRFSVKAND